MDNQFKYLVEGIKVKYSLTHRKLAEILKISEVSFYRYYSGAREAKASMIETLKTFTISEEELEKVRIEEEKKEEFYNFTSKLDKLNDEHKKLVYEMIESYTKEENITKKLTIENNN